MQNKTDFYMRHLQFCPRKKLENLLGHFLGQSLLYEKVFFFVLTCSCIICPSCPKCPSKNKVISLVYSQEIKNKDIVRI